MKQFRFLDFQMYKDSINLLKKIRTIISRYSSQEFSLKDQTYRATISVILNIAEWSWKESDADFKRYLTISLGSIHEILACLDIARNLNLIENETFFEIQKDISNITNQIGGFIKKLK